MDMPAFVEDLQQRIAALLDGTPAADLQKNLKAVLAQQFARLEATVAALEKAAPPR